LAKKIINPGSSHAKVDKDLEQRKKIYIDFCEKKEVIGNVLKIVGSNDQDKDSRRTTLEDLQKQIFAIKSNFVFNKLVTSTKQRTENEQKSKFEISLRRKNKNTNRIDPSYRYAISDTRGETEKF
jgi:hypothetical protein